MSEIPTRYNAQDCESSWYSKWAEADLFAPDPNPEKPRYTVTIPPPNVTGSLHMGHALNYSIHDLFGRYQRLKGKSVLILPGQDHAGIATQSVVDKLLRKEGSSAFQLGREKFVERVWQWRAESGGTILKQLRSLGCAFDWSRDRFTLDPGYAEAVLQVFIDWFNRGLIYKGKRVVNWDVTLKTSVSDIETERKLIKGKLYHIRYPFADGSGSVEIATTRPETMLADVAVAVHPSDARYAGLHGKMLILPLVGREIPLVADTYPDPEFGTGAVKITPAHDPNDFEVGVRHNLEMPVILTEDGKITGGTPYDGLDRNEARKQIVHDLEEAGFLVRVEDHDIPIIISERSKDVIEPLLSEQWFVRQTELAKPALQAAQEGRLKFSPERYTRVYCEWLENIRDWCISRQLWWGHRIPVYYTESGEAFAALSWEQAQSLAGDKKIVRQEEDVLDTWFSSGLWPFATLGWPAETDDLKERYPTDLLITAQEILYLWVARMVMMGLDQRKDLPFPQVMIYATVLTADGKRMSKSLGNGVDPLQVVESAGADALRYTLLSQTGENQDIRYSDKKIDEARFFQTKIWNATRFALLNIKEMPAEPSPEALHAVDKWLLSRLANLEKKVSKALDEYNCQTACQALYHFFWTELCDWYIEVAKPRLNSESESQVPQWVLLHSIEAFLTMLHPFMPFLTEELYSYLPLTNKSPFLMSASWPKLPDWFTNPAEEAEVERAFALTRGLRALRADVDLAPNVTVEKVYFEGELGAALEIVRSQAKVKELVSGKPQGEKFISTTLMGVDFHLPIQGLIDTDKELARIERERTKISEDLGKLQERLSNPQFTEKAKPELVERDRALAADLADRLSKLEARAALLAN